MCQWKCFQNLLVHLHNLQWTDLFSEVSQWSSHHSCGHVCVCSHWTAIEVIRVTLPELCAGSIVESSYQQSKLHFPSRLDHGPIRSGKLEWSSQAWPWPGISKGCTLIVELSKSHFTLSLPQPPPWQTFSNQWICLHYKAISMCSQLERKRALYFKMHKTI